MRVAALILLAACTAEEALEVSTGEDPNEYATRYCKERNLQCGRVYAFETPADNPLGRVELCVMSDDLPAAEALYGASELSPDPRFDMWYALGVEPFCLWSCPAPEHGCNAYGGNDIKACFCPEAL